MKKKILHILLLLLTPLLVKGQSSLDTVFNGYFENDIRAESDYSAWTKYNKLVNYVKDSLTTASISYDSIILTSENILAGDSVLIASNSNTVKSINIIMRDGDKYTYSGTDSTIIYVITDSVSNSWLQIPNLWMTRDYPGVEANYFDADRDLNSPLWINIADGFSGGTRSIKIEVESR